jgi:hypothetical protein
MTTTAMATTLEQLFDYLGDDRWELGDLIIDFCEGGKFWNPHTEALLKQLVDAMPEPDNFTIDDLAEEILRVGTTYAVAIAQDIHCAI